jgi:RNA polymerase sigma-32 factor
MAPSRNLPVLADPLQAYLSRIGEIPLLSPEEERTLARQWYEEHDIDAARRLVLANLRFVVKIANGYQRYGLRALDLIQEGNLGLMVAVRRFNPDRGVRLISYAVFWIRAYILSFIMRSWRMVRIGTTRGQRRLFFKLRETERQLRQLESSEAVSPERVGRELGVSTAETVEMEQLLGGHDLSLDAPVHGDEPGGRSVIEVLPSGALDPEQTLSLGEGASLQRHRVREALTRLNAREREIIERRYLGDEPASLADLGRERGLSRERMRQIESRALEKLRAALRGDAPEIIDVEAEPAPPSTFVLPRDATQLELAA